MCGLRVSAACLGETEERLFPLSRHRSKRIHKKLVKRFGGEFWKKPTAYVVGGHTLVVHPAVLLKLRTLGVGRATTLWEGSLWV